MRLFRWLGIMIGVNLTSLCHGETPTKTVSLANPVKSTEAERTAKNFVAEKKVVPIATPQKPNGTPVSSGKTTPSAPSKPNAKKNGTQTSTVKKKATQTIPNSEKTKSQSTKIKTTPKATSKKETTSATKAKKISTIRYLKLSEIARSLKFSTRPLSGGGMLAEKQGVTIKIFPDKNTITYQQSDIFLQHPTKKQGSEILISYADYLNIFVSLLAVKLVAQKAPKVQTIILDPGHGGKDPGAENKSLLLQEKTLTLTLAQQLRTELQKKGYKVELTRESDRFLELKDRSTYSKKGQLFVSIHLNSASNKQAAGAEVYTLKRGQNFGGNTFDAWNLIAGYSLLSAYTETTGLKNRGIKYDNLGVLKGLECPGILLEAWFMSNESEGKNSTDTIFIKKAIQGLVEGIEKYSNIVKSTY